MSQNFKIIITTLLSLTFTSQIIASPIETLERERAKTLSYVLDKNISVSDRKKFLKQSKIRLLDLERMAINNKNISTNPDYNTIKAFENFDLTFLVHSSLEKGRSLSITWLEMIGLTTNNLMNTKVIRK